MVILDLKLMCYIVELMANALVKRIRNSWSEQQPQPLYASAKQWATRERHHP